MKMRHLQVLHVVILLVACFARASDHLEYGIPGPYDQLLDREGFALGYSSEWKQPRWVSYRLTSDEVVSAVVVRSNDFQPDPDIRGSQAQLEDYRGSGYDRGHNVPSADMKWSARAMRECFYLSNMSPQDGACNSGIWNEIENTVRGFACHEGKVFVLSGPYVECATPKTIGKTCRVMIPDGFWKVVYDETPPCKMIGFLVPNRQCPGKPVAYACSVSKIEKKTGLEFFKKLPADKQALKRTFNALDWDWSKSQRKYAASDGIKPLPNVVSCAKTLDSYFSGIREEYSAGGAMPVGSRKAAPVCDKWPDTGWWLSTNSNKRHNRKCENYRKTRGYPCQKDEGVPCGKCGG